MYGRLYIPTSRIDALYSTRLSPTVQASVAAISNPVPAQRRSLASTPNQSPSQSEVYSPNGWDGSNVMLSLQHDTGRWCTEYTWSADDGMWGARVLHNFGRLANESNERTAGERVKRVDEEDAMEGGLKGRFSAGAEVYFSAKEKSAGGMSV
jgi:mitochondrial distribution and morphology protein 10